MTANIKQNIVPRHKTKYSFRSYVTLDGSWRTKQQRTSRFFSSNHPFSSRLRFSQRGSVTQSTLTLALALVSVIGVSLVGFFYLQQVFGTASHGSDVQALENQVIQLQEKQDQLELEGSRLRSIQAVEKRVQDLNLVQTDRVSYLVTQPDHIAVAAK
ncbi:MAG: hypothetical protein Q8P73_05075 [bacterium]|nr:hypothetical protein [bacterium]MDZ4342314.1 hypothetical protein [Candidatus Binatia bacterium]